jgi:Sec-independent protein secretion pathway components
VLSTATLPHQKQQNLIPHWGVTSTRQRLIANYWLNHVTGHFALLLTIAVLFSLLSSGDIGPAHLLVILIVGILAFGVLLFFHYWPGFIRDFLPRLESVVDAYRTEQQQQIIAHLREKMTLQQKHFQQQITTLTRLAEQQKDEIKKCRQAQLSNFALTLIYYVLAKTSGMPDPKSNDHTPQLLMQLYGIDPGSIRANLELITGNGRRKSLSDRKRTELVNRFDEAYRFFEEQGFTAGMLLLKDLEVRIVGY